ncbi:MAG: hypothetical protein GF364_11380 [Candidatus Lokiarchaeota archaeon]|nr:hypothetical protein [Candidatus Lokiarchaeota archaeon]
MSVRKLEDYAEISLFCPECRKNITLKVSYEHRDRAERFPFEYLYVHGEGGNKHAITLYLDKDMQVRGTELMRNIETDESDIQETKMFPIKKGKVSPMARSLGMISQKEFEILEMCNGKSSVYAISQEKNISLVEINKIVQKLKDKSFLEINIEE